ncbi:hypothetical protein SteCoe_9431 [Stentor coeruleus]|uniref:t-SNARE coiled-coil homology domain-containing protein n=1 Tax=Stentor coeruleus TaxID=5963 RepID=A0A1R2CHU5_9CILI|nr:hypothetical protein SteCoe_9431 [Stentor coeruleus]
MESLKSPLNDNELELRIRMVQEALRKLENAIAEQEKIDTLNELCEETEACLKSLSSYQAKTSKETREQKTAVGQFTSNFDNLVSNVEKSLNNRPKPVQTYDSFENLESHIIRHTAEESKVVQQKMVIVGEIMKDCSEMIGTQGQILDRIDVEVQNAKKNTEKGVTELEKTDLRQRRKKSCCWIIMIAALGFLVGIVVVVVMISKK